MSQQQESKQVGSKYQGVYCIWTGNKHIMQLRTTEGNRQLAYFWISSTANMEANKKLVNSMKHIYYSYNKACKQLKRAKRGNDTYGLSNE